MRRAPGTVARLAALLLLAATRAHAQPPTAHWRAVVDAYWGPGAPAAEQLRLFDTFWTFADTAFAAFHNLDLDWDAVRDAYRGEVAAGVSRGRFAGIMNHLALALREPHTYALDSLVNVHTRAAPGVPLLFGVVRGDNGFFGACLTPLPDSSLLVYASVPDHPLGLRAGDRVLGYDGVPWRTLYPALLRAELPLAFGPGAPGAEASRWPRARSSWGSAPSAYAHGWLAAAGMNWHLFETLDAVDYETGDTLHLPVAPLAEGARALRCTEQLPVPGAAMPDPASDRYVSRGVVDGTRIGYVYVWSWYEDRLEGRIEADFLEAVRALVVDEDVDGLVFDYRFNPGGFPHFANPGYALLFDGAQPTLGVAWRRDPGDRFTLQPTRGFVPFLDVPDTPAGAFDGPIAVLTGPGAVSAGDYNATRLAYHPRARFFGKSTSSSYAPAYPVPLGVPGWSAAVSFVEAYRLEAPGQYLTHTEGRVDEPVWLAPDDVVRGEDTVVRAALGWMRRVGAGVGEEPAPPDAFTLGPAYPNPSSDRAHLDVTLPAGGHVTLRLYDALGREVATLADGFRPAGTHRLAVEAHRLGSGVYFCVARLGDRMARRTLLVVR